MSKITETAARTLLTTVRTLSLPVRLLQSLAQRLGARWKPVHQRLLVLRPLWPAAIITVGASAAFQVPQARDALRDLTSLTTLQPWCLLAAAWILASAAWYFPRAALYVRYEFTPTPDERFAKLRLRAPRVLGALPLFSLAVASFWAGEWLLGLGSLAVTGLFLLFVVMRKRLLSGAARSDARVAQLEENLQPGTYYPVLGLLGLGAGMLVLFVLLKVGPAQLVGPLGILCLAAAMWIAFGTMVLLYPTNRYGVPSLVAVLTILAALFSLGNDNHQVRTLQATSSWRGRPVAKQLEAWLAHRRPAWESAAGAETPLPFVVVATEGGGIRAAYWTASVLAHIEQEMPRFACHVFAISGVSGGSVGAAVFAALLADRIESDDSYLCGQPVGDPVAGDQLLAKARAVLGEDFLAPALAGLLFPDLAQRFWFLGGSKGLPDRATYLEESWEAAWRKAKMEECGGDGQTADRRGCDRFAEDFVRLWGEGAAIGEELRDRLALGVPSLFLNATWVASGQRTVTSPLEVSGDPAFHEVDDTLAKIGNSIRLSTAAHMGARFTYISPAGTIGRSPTKRQVVDGGYFENSGTLTATEIVRLLKRECGGRHTPPGTYACRGLPVRPLLIYIQNSKEGNDKKGRWRMPLGETLSPVRALLATRGARGRLALDQFRGLEAQEEHFFHFSMDDFAAEAIPLGWALSKETQEEIGRRLETPRFRAELDRLGAALRVSSAPAADDPAGDR